MVNWIKRRTYHEGTESSLVFDRIGETRSGYAFPIDTDGRVSADLADFAAVNLMELLTGTHPDSATFQPPYVHTYAWRRTDPAVIRCACRRPVTLEGFTNTCECGADYNMSGQRLAARECWGEETGETAADILGGTR